MSELKQLINEIQNLAVESFEMLLNYSTDDEKVEENINQYSKKENKIIRSYSILTRVRYFFYKKIELNKLKNYLKNYK